jgi:hypothetical protein
MDSEHIPCSLLQDQVSEYKKEVPCIEIPRSLLWGIFISGSSALFYNE